MPEHDGEFSPYLFFNKVRLEEIFSLVFDYDKIIFIAIAVFLYIEVDVFTFLHQILVTLVDFVPVLFEHPYFLYHSCHFYKVNIVMLSCGRVVSPSVTLFQIFPSS